MSDFLKSGRRCEPYFFVNCNFIRTKVICIGKQKTHEQFVEELRMKNSNIEVLGTYTKACDPLLCRCVTHNYEWSPQPYRLLQGQGCPVCGQEKCYAFSQTRKPTNENFSSRLAEKFPQIVPIESYINSSTPIEMFCTIHNHYWKARPNDLLRGHGCPKCGREKAANNKAYSHEEFVEELSKRNPDVEVIGEYRAMKAKIKCRCRICSAIWEPQALNLFYANSGCPVCSESKGEKLIRQYLQETAVNFCREYKFDDCRNVYALPYDFAILNNDNVVIGLIEYDGEQHFKPVKHFGGESHFQMTSGNDAIKNKYAEDNKIPLLRCNYLQSNEQVLSELASFIETIYKK